MSELPLGWHGAELGEFMVERGGSVNPALFPDEEFDLYSIPAHDRGGFDVARGDEIGSSKRVVAPGDVMVSRIVPHIQRVRIVDPIGTRRQIASTEWISFRSSVHDPYFLRYFLLSGEFHDQFMRTVSGVGGSLNRAQPSQVRHIRVPVPPIDEQRRIVAILEDHLSRLDASSSSLTAVSRRSELLGRSALALVAPKNAPLVPLGQLAIDRGYGTSTKCAVDAPGVPVARIPNLVRGRIDMANEKRVINPAVDLSGLMLSEGDLLIIRTNGSKELIGRSAVVQSGVKASFASYLIRYVFDSAKVRPEWVRLMLERPQARFVLESLAASSAGQYNLSLGKLDGVSIPLPDLTEQDALLESVGFLLDEQRRLTAITERAVRESRALRRSLLAAAFRGDLTGGRLVV